MDFFDFLVKYSMNINNNGINIYKIKLVTTATYKYVVLDWYDCVKFDLLVNPVFKPMYKQIFDTTLYWYFKSNTGIVPYLEKKIEDLGDTMRFVPETLNKFHEVSWRRMNGINDMLLFKRSTLT